MPHKHTRRDQDLATFDLPPTRIARPLPTAPAPKQKGHNQTSTTKPRKVTKPQTQGAKRKRDAKTTASVGTATKSDDTPRAFRRLMAVASGKRVRSGLDSGAVAETKRQKKEKRAAAAAAAAAAEEEAAAQAETEAEAEFAEHTGQDDTANATTNPSPAPAPAPAASSADIPTIRPGEKLADFYRRVDAALPLSGALKSSMPNSSGGKDPLGLTKTFRTRQERKLHKLYSQWREDDVRIKEREAEALEEADERDAEIDEAFGSKWRRDYVEASSAVLGGSSRAGKKKKRNAGGSGNNYVGGGDDDLWGEFNRTRSAATKSMVRANIHNVVDAPPERLTKIDSSKFSFAKKKKQDGSGKGSAEVAAAAAAAAKLVREARA